MLSHDYTKSHLAIFLTLWVMGSPCLGSAADQNTAALSWKANTEEDLSGYNVYHGTKSGEYDPPSILGKTNAYTATGLHGGMTHYFSVTAIDSSGNESLPTPEVSKIIPAGASQSLDSSILINYQPQNSLNLNGYLNDHGQSYSSSLGYGWIHSSGNFRDRGKHSEQRLDTLVYVWGGKTATWQYNLPNGDYLISLGSGDSAYSQGPHQVLIEGTPVINNIATAKNEFITITDWPVTIADGGLTVSLGGPSSGVTTLNYLTITPVSSPSSNELSVAIEGNGTVTSQPAGISCSEGTCSSNFQNNSVVSLSAIPTEGWTFSGWKGACSNESTCTLTLSNTQTITAHFEPIGFHTLSVTLDGKGTVTSKPTGIICIEGTCKGEFPNSSAVVLTAKPEDEWSFQGWNGACNGSDICSLTLSTDVVINAAFATTTSAPPDTLPPDVPSFEPVLINFQKMNSPTPNDHLKDYGQPFSSSLGYGWDQKLRNARDRERQSDQRLDTFLFLWGGKTATWQYNLPNGDYLISLGSGDPAYAQGPHQVRIEGVPVINNISTRRNQFVTITDWPVTVTDGALTVTIGGSRGVTALNYLSLKPLDSDE